MPLIIKREITVSTQLGIWKIEEDAGWFHSQLLLDERENKLIDSLKHPQRRLHWLSSRVLIRTLMKTDQFIHIESDENGKPVIHNFERNLSLSHSGDLSALLLSGKFEVGIDIEKIDPKIFRIEHKFVSAEEQQYLHPDKKLEQLYVIWCVKEAMYKLYGQKQLDFRDHLFVKPFEYREQGEVAGILSKGDTLLKLSAHYEELNGYMVAYVVK